MTALAPTVWLVALDRYARDRWAVDVVSDEELRRAQRFGLSHLAGRYIVGRAALRLLLGAAMDEDPRVIPIKSGRHGKPYVAGADAPAFNVSHCGDTAAIAVASGRAVGVDIEAAGRVRDPLRLAVRFFSACEADDLTRLPPTLIRAAFARCWTAKEAVLKALGVGLAGGLDSVVVRASPCTCVRILRLPSPHLVADWTLHGLELPDPRLTGAFAARAPGVPEPVVRVFEVDAGPGGYPCRPAIDATREA